MANGFFYKFAAQMKKSFGHISAFIAYSIFGFNIIIIFIAFFIK